jgi:hypothetical protein
MLRIEVSGKDLFYSIYFILRRHGGISFYFVSVWLFSVDYKTCERKGCSDPV